MDDKISLGIFGASGRMGRSITSLAAQDPTFHLGALFTHSKSKHLAPPFILDTAPHSVDLYIDVSLPEALPAHLNLALSSNRPIVIGITGLSPAHHLLIQQASRQIPLLYAPNFSLGMALFQKLVRETARHFPNCNIDLIETHHTQKKDAPSGSALLLAKTIEEERSTPPHIHSIRSGQIPGIHQLLFNSPEEQITLTHTVHSRDLFARGALAAARFLSTQPPGLYNIASLLENGQKEGAALR